MRRISICVLSVFVVLPAMASARLPVVNIASGGVSARSAFGDNVAAHAEKKAPEQVAPTRTKKVVARTAVKKTPAPIDNGEQILASDVLTPRRPSPDLWAKSDSALRMPMPDEFSVIRSDNALPEENLERALAVAPSVPSAPSVAPRIETRATTSDNMDTQIARLAQLQHRADNSVRNVSSRVIAAPIAETSVDVPVRIASADAISEPAQTEPVSVRRLVVPVEHEDVVVRSVEKNTSPRIAAVRDDMSKMNPAELRRAFRKTFLSENKHLSTFPIDNSYDVASDMSTSIEGFTARHDLSEAGTGIRPLEIKIKFRNEDSSLSRDNYTLLTEYASIVVSKPTRAIQVAIPQHMTTSKDARKLAARRLAIVEQVLTDNGIAQQRIVPVLSNREEQGFVLRIISSDQYETLTQQQQDIFGDTIGKKTYKSMTW